MAKFLVGLAWLLIVFDFSILATVNLDERMILRGRRPPEPMEIEQEPENDPDRIERMKDADGKTLHLYVLPVGQGDAQILQCPNGDITIIDLGSSSGKNKGFWSVTQIQQFLNGHIDKIKNIVITHNDKDHFNLFKDVFLSASDFRKLNNVYISCTYKKMATTLQNWFKPVKNKIKEFNGGNACGSSTNNAPKIFLCPSNLEITTEVLSANAGGCKQVDGSSDKQGSSNKDSIVMMIKFKTFSMQLNGDFEGAALQNKLVNCLGKRIEVTVYKLAHHGAESKANNQNMCLAVKPRAVFASSDPWNQGYRHPRCRVIDLFKDHLCKPAETEEKDPAYCGNHPIIDEEMICSYRLQEKYECGEGGQNGKTKSVHRNGFAIYTTAPTEKTMNLVHLLTNGNDWGFVNDIRPRLL